MYINYNGAKYPCSCRPSATMVYSDLPEDFPAPAVCEITLCADDGFVMRTDNPADYLRQTFEGGVLTLTNQPEPVEPEPPEPIEPGQTTEARITALEAAMSALLTGEG